MAEEPMLGLFDGETNFLDELAGTGPEELGPAPGIGGGGMMGVSNPGMQQHMQGQPQQGMMLGGQQTPATSMSGSYPSGMGQDGSAYSGMQGSQGGIMSHQQYGTDQYGQFPGSKMGHGQAMMMGPSGQQQQQQPHMQAQQGPFSPSMGGNMMQQQSGYTGYNMGPHGHSQQQSMSQMSPMMSPNPGWNQNQTSPNQPTQSHTHGQFMSPGGAPAQMPQYMNQSYHPQQIQQMNQYNPTKMAAPTSPYMHSSNPMPAGMTSPPASMNMMGPMQARGPHSNNPVYHGHQVPASQHNSTMQGGYNQLNQGMSAPTTSQYPGEIMQPHGPNQMNSVPLGQHFPPYSGGQQPRPDSSGSMCHYTSQCPTTAYCPPYPTMAQPRPSSTTPSPRPTPPPQSMTPNHSSNSQGTYGQSSLQQLEQLVSPSMAGTNPYQQLMQQSSTSPTSSTAIPGQQQQGPIYSSANFPTTTVPSTVSMAQAGNSQATIGIPTNQGHVNMQGQLTMQNSAGMGNYPGQGQIVPKQISSGPMSPNQSMLPLGQAGMEIQRIEQQLQQLMNMPQNQQVSQQMLDIQEKLRILRSQHQLHMQQQHSQNPQMRQPVHPQQQPGIHGGNVHMQQQMMPQMRPMRPGPPTHMQPMPLNSQPMQMQQQGYPRGSGLAPGQMPGPMPSSQSIALQSIPSPQKVQPFQSIEDQRAGP